MLDSPPKIILVVEDDLSSRLILEGILTKFGYQVCVACNGIHALELLKNKSFDVVLMDLVMPDMDGYETTRRIRTGHPEVLHPHIPILALTADSSSDTMRQCRETGMNGCLTKPVDPRMLQTIVGQCLDGDRWVNPVQSTIPSLDDRNQMNPESVTLPVLDWNETIRNVGGTIESAREILAIGMEDLPPLLDRLANSIHAGDFTQARRLAHTLKGESGNLGAHRLRLHTIRMESLLQENDLSSIREQMGHLQREFQNVAQAIDSIIQNPLPLEETK